MPFQEFFPHPLDYWTSILQITSTSIDDLHPFSSSPNSNEHSPHIPKHSAVLDSSSAGQSFIFEYFKLYFIFVIKTKMDFFRRIGTDRHKFKVEFFLRKLRTAAKLKGDVYVTIKRGDHKKSTDEKFPMGEDGVCDFKNQILTFDSLTLFFDSDQKKYQEKQGEIRLVIVTKKGDKKLLGNIEFDLAKFANSGKENHKIVQEFGEKVKFTFEYEVYAKCMGQASQTSKSVSKQESNQKKDSSLNKFVAFFKGQEQEDKKSAEKAKSKKDQKQVGKPHKEAKEKEKEKQKQKPSDTSKSKEKYTKKPIQPMSEKRDKRKQKNSSQEQEGGEDSDDEFRKRTMRNKKNIVTTRGKNTLTENESGSMREYQQSNKQGLSDEKQPNNQKLFFDVPSTFAKNEQKNTHTSEYNGKIEQEQPKNHTSVGIKRTQKNTNSLPNNQILSQQNDLIVKQYLQKIQNLEKNVEQKNREISSQKNQSQQRISSLEEKIKTLEKQNRKLEQKNQTLIRQKQEMQQSFLKLPKNQNVSSKAIFETERDFGQAQGNSKEQQKIKELEKEKGQLLVKIQSLEEKYSKDFKKYKQICEQYEQEREQSNSQIKGELKQVKEQLAKQKIKNEKILEKYQQTNNQMKNFKQKQNDLKDQLAVAMNNLSQMKLKIGDMLNDANQQNDRSMIDALTLLSQT